MTRVLVAALAAAVVAQNNSGDLVRAKDGIFTCVSERDGPTGPRTKCFGNLVAGIDEATHNPFNAPATCFRWCTDAPCLALEGNRTQECGACSAAAKCHPTAADWAKKKSEMFEADLICEAHCEGNKCEELTGNPSYECAGCKAPFMCHPDAEHFGDYTERTANAKHEL